MDILALLGVIIAVIGLGYAVKTYQNDHVEKPNNEKQHLLVQFRSNQTLARQVKDELTQYAVNRNAFDVYMFQGVTYKMYIAELDNCLNETNLADKYYDRMTTLNLTSNNIQSMQKSLETQFENLLQIQTTTRLLARG